jgi:hypothetical protein
MNDTANETLTQVDFTTEELTVLLRLIGAALPQFQPLNLSDAEREAALRALYARGVLTADETGQFAVNGGAALLATAGVQARVVAQLDRPSQNIRDIVYVLDGFVVRQSEPLAGVQRFQILDTPYKLVAFLSAALNIDPEQTGAPIGEPISLMREEWRAARDAAIDGVPTSLVETLAAPNAVVGMTTVAVLEGQPQAPRDVLLLGHPSGGYWLVIFEGETVNAYPVDSVGAVQAMVDLLG